MDCEGLWISPREPFYGTYVYSFFLKDIGLLIDPTNLSPQQISQWPHPLTTVWFTHYHKTISFKVKSILDKLKVSYHRYPSTYPTLSNIRVIPFPGHTSDSIIVQWKHDDHVHLFTGDSLYGTNDYGLRITYEFSENIPLLKSNLESLKTLESVTHVHPSVGPYSTIKFKDKKHWIIQLQRAINQRH